MKKHLKLWITLLTLTLVFIIGFTVSALAADEAESADPSDPLYTPYGMIPTDYASVESYPFVAFDDKGTFLGASDYLWTDGNKATATAPADPAAIIHKVWKKTGTFYIYMRRNYTITYAFFNISAVNGNVIIDLGGNTLTYNQQVSAQIKAKGNNTRVTFKNGNLHAGANKTFIAAGVIEKDDRAQAMSFSFENIRFSLRDGYTQSNWVLGIDSSKTNTFAPKGYYCHLNIKNCTFDTSNVANNIYIAMVGHQSGQIASDVLLCGIHIDGPAGYFNLIKQSYTEDVTVSYAKNENGHYMTNTRPTTDAIPEQLSFYDLPEGAMALCLPLSTEGTNTTYTFGTHERLTPYGWIDTATFNNSSYPILLFNNQTKQLVWKGDRWGNEGATDGGVLYNLYAKNQGSHAIYFQANQKDTTSVAYYNFGNISGTHIIDLNGNTLTATANVFHLQAKTKNNTHTVSYIIKNGTIDFGSYSLLNIGSGTYSLPADATYDAYTMTTDMTFENVTFNITTGVLATDGGLNGANFKTVTNLNFKECTFVLTGARSRALFYLGNTGTGTATDKNTGETFTTDCKNFAIHATIEGCSFITDQTTIPTLYANPGKMDNKTLTFTKGKNGYATFQTATSTTVRNSEKLVSAEGDNYFFLAETTDTTNTYTFGIAHKYGYIAPIFADTTKYPIVIFDIAKGYSVAGFDKWGDETTSDGSQVGGAAEYMRKNSGTDLLMFLQSDLPTTSIYYNCGQMYGTKVIDLNGHTIKLSSTFFHGEMKNKSQLDLVIKNGTFNVGTRVVVTAFAVISANLDPTGKISNITFENINFVNIADGGRIFAEPTNGSDKPIETNVRYVNCTYQIKDGNTQSLILYGTNTATSPSHKINLSVEGGAFTYAGNLVPIHSYKYADAAENQNVVYKPYNGAYPTVTVVKGVDTASATYPAENGATLALRMTAQGETQTTFTMTPVGFVSAYLNLTNDLNFVYRVFVPASYVAPVMTFTVGTSVVEVTAFKTDENGYALYRLPNINPARMGELITATLSATVGEETVTLTHNTLSVKAYVEVLKALEEEKEEEKRNTALITLVDNLLVYGAAAQQYEGQSADTFVTEIGELSEIPENTGVLTFTGTTSEKGGIGYFGVNLDGAFAIRLGVQANVAGLTLVAKCGEEEVVYNLDDYTAKDGIITIVYDGILANELDTKVTFTLMDGEEAVGKVLTANINAYLARVCDGADANLATLAKALYAYGESAKTYAK